jgi:DNA-binding transcriptional MerR regulator
MRYALHVLIYGFYKLILHSTMTQMYSISDLAQEFGVTTRTIRHYEEQGLLTPQRQGMIRVFSARDRIRLKLALRGKRLGFSLAEIRELFELSSLARSKSSLPGLKSATRFSSNNAKILMPCWQKSVSLPSNAAA